MAVLGGGGIKSVQRGYYYFQNPYNEPRTTTITAVDTSKSFMTATNNIVRYVASTHNYHGNNVSARLTDSTTVTFNRSNTGANGYCAWEVIEFA